jgi:hypothetical protein
MSKADEATHAGHPAGHPAPPPMSGKPKHGPSERSAYEKWLDVLSIEADMVGTADIGEIIDDVISAILEAEDMSSAIDIAKNSALDSGKTLVDVEQRVQDLTFHHSTIASPEGQRRFRFFCRVTTVRLDTGEEIKYNVGAPNVCALLFKAREASLLPYECVIRARDMGEGKVLLSIDEIPRRVA